MGKSLILVLFSILALAVKLGNCGQRMDIILSARDFPKEDYWSESDPYAKVFYKFDASHNWIDYGRTTTVDNSGSPNWPEVFSFDYVPGSTQTIRFELWDEEVIWDEFVGTIDLQLSEIIRKAHEGGGMAVEWVIPPGNAKLLMKVRIDGSIP